MILFNVPRLHYAKSMKWLIPVFSRQQHSAWVFILLLMTLAIAPIASSLALAAMDNTVPCDQCQPMTMPMHDDGQCDQGGCVTPFCTAGMTFFIALPGASGMDFLDASHNGQIAYRHGFYRSPDSTLLIRPPIT